MGEIRKEIQCDKDIETGNGELKKRVVAITAKVRRYQGRTESSVKTESFRMVKGNFIKN